MKLGLLTNLFGYKSLDELLPYLKSLGLEAVEIGCGGYPGKDHCHPEDLLADDNALKEFSKKIADNGMFISSLSCHGNMVHPNHETAQRYIDDFKNAVLLAEKLGIDTINTFSGCPGDGAGGQRPNWVTCPWPDDFSIVLKYQWEDVLIPFWIEMVPFCIMHGVTKIALEMHPGFCVYNPETLLRLREEVGPNIGANFDPSHLFWQGINPAAAIAALGHDCIFHFHAKDTRMAPNNCRVNGVLDCKSYGDIGRRSWVFRSVGYGADEADWRNMMNELVLVGYDYVLSIEHEDALMSAEEGLEKSVEQLKRLMIREGIPPKF